MTLKLNRDNYEEEVLKSTLPVVVDFWGPQCGPCLALMPAVENLEKKYQEKIKVAKLDSSGNRMLCARLRVLSLPTFLFYKGGKEVDRLTGDKVTEKDLIEAIEKLM